MRVDLPLDKKNCGKSGLGHRAAGPWAAGRGPRATGPSGRRAAGPSRAVGRGPAFSKTHVTCTESNFLTVETLAPRKKPLWKGGCN